MRLAFFALVGFALGGFHCVGGIQQDPSEFRPEPLTISLGLNALRYVVDRSPGRPLSAPVSEDVVAELLRVAEARTMSQHQPGVRPQHGNVVGYGAGVGRAGADVNHSDASIAGLDEMKSWHLRRALRDNARRSSA